MRQCLLLLLLLGLGLSSCAPSLHRQAAPRPWRRYYHREQRQHERERRRTLKTNVTWSSL
ncbi:hypothetical protein GO988_23595 [Hymenobacter sp. HMF4947]|uniref:Uncharacterized protein n=1 Tax=Hymenobacter ginkgonis TaxID=2682976 RepID=A0A7K1TLN0_9BACT|nr:hypothetical protein [Hymenobacter ginkgonis]MVN79328.1 hypothetical protein [Hymenobacter ginkgonis]